MNREIAQGMNLLADWRGVIYLADMKLLRFVSASLCLFLLAGCASQPASLPKPLKALFLTGGGYHDYVSAVPDQ
jgi:hypothetical protein